MMMPSSDNVPKEKGLIPLTQKHSTWWAQESPSTLPHGITQFLDVTAQWEMVNEWPDAIDLKWSPRALSTALPIKKSLLHLKASRERLNEFLCRYPSYTAPFCYRNSAVTEGVNLEKFRNEEMQLKSSPPMRKRWGIPSQEHPQCSRPLQSC